MIHTDRIAVVILNWNGREMMRRFLPSVVEGSKGDGLVIVADNGSDDGALEMLAKEFPTVERLPLERNYGFANGYNEAFKHIDAPYYLLLNSDVEVPKGWLRPLKAYMDAHSEVAVVQPKLRSQREPARFEYAGAAGGFVDCYGYPFCRGRIFDEVETDKGQYDAIEPLLWATGAALMIRQADWVASGGLDGRFFAHMEEIDLCWRLRTRGRQIVCVPQSIAYHVGGATLAAGNPKKTYLNFRNNLLMLYKNLPDEQLRPVMRMRRLLDGVAALQFLLKGQVDQVRAIVRARRDYHRMLPDFVADRQLNRSLAIDDRSLAGRAPFSILWQYYARGRKKFSLLKF